MLKPFSHSFVDIASCIFFIISPNKLYLDIFLLENCDSTNYRYLVMHLSISFWQFAFDFWFIGFVHFSQYIYICVCVYWRVVLLQFYLLETMSFMDPIPPFSTKQWQVIIFLFIDALSVSRVPSIAPYMTSKRRLLHKVLFFTILYHYLINLSATFLLSFSRFEYWNGIIDQ